VDFRLETLRVSCKAHSAENLFGLLYGGSFRFLVVYQSFAVEQIFRLVIPDVSRMAPEGFSPLQ
jgi:hypothetical protein